MTADSTPPTPQNVAAALKIASAPSDTLTHILDYAIQKNGHDTVASTLHQKGWLEAIVAMEQLPTRITGPLKAADREKPLPTEEPAAPKETKNLKKLALLHPRKGPGDCLVKKPS